MRLYSKQSRRLYVNRSERERFKKAAEQQAFSTKLLCFTLLYTGCRLSEAINLTWDDIQQDEGVISIRSLKKRKLIHTREIPVPPTFVKQLDMDCNSSSHHFLFSFDRTTAWRRVKQVMQEAKITGVHATPKGLRHSFAMWAAYNSIPITLCQKWMGHADVRTTAIYYQIVGSEEIELAARMW